jgi:uncharacterized oxidoreductase
MNVVLITGGTTGAGLEMAKIYKKMGWKVVVCARKTRPEVEKENIDFIPCDLTDFDGLKGLKEKFDFKYSRLDLLVNNAGAAERFSIFNENRILEKTEYEWKLNYAAPLFLISLFRELLQKSQGKIVNITSGLIYAPLAIEPNYCAYKAAMHSLTISLRQQLSSVNVKVCEVFYPQMNTEFQKGIISDQAVDPPIAASLAVKGIEKGKTEIHIKTAGLLRSINRFSTDLARNIMFNGLKNMLSNMNLTIESFTEEKLQNKLSQQK